MIRFRSLRAPLLLAACGLAAASCGGATTPTSTATAPAATRAAPSRAAPSASAAPATAAAPDNLQVQVTKAGFGRYQLLTLPVAEVRNLSAGHTAVNVVVTFRILGAGNAVLVNGTDTLPELGPGQTAIVSGTTEPPGTPVQSDATAAVGQWVSGTPVAITSPGPGAYTCQQCTGAGNGDVAVTLTSSSPDVPNPIHIGVECNDAAGTIVGGGAGPSVWPQGKTSFAVSWPVLVSAQPASCIMSAVASP